jgi:small GTP-binding protein
MNYEDNIPNCKVTLVGDSGVGKSSIIGRFVAGIFSDNISSTSGLNYSQKYYEKEGKKIRLNLWDTAGQEKFRSLGRSFYKDSYIILIVYDICNRASFENIKEIWYPEVTSNSEKIRIIAIVGNKKDKYEEEEVTDQEASSYAKEINANFFLVSANSGDGIDYMFEKLIDNYFDEEFMCKVEESKEERIDSIILNREDFKSNSISTSYNNCC